MAQRYQSGSMAIGGATVVVHGLAGTPTEYSAALQSPSNVYFAGVSQTNMVVAATAALGAQANVFASIPHSTIQ